MQIPILALEVRAASDSCFKEAEVAGVPAAALLNSRRHWKVSSEGRNHVNLR